MNHVSIIPAAIMCMACVMLPVSCTDTGSYFGGNSGKVLKFYSAEDPGRWADKAADHEVKATIIEDAKGRKGIEVSVPFTSAMDEQHYVEAIVLVDADGRELAKKSFQRGEKAQALFELSDTMKFPLYVVSKCNMHEMWRKKITGSEQPQQ